MQAVILAGGKGTRLAERLQGRPKPLVLVDGVPLLERQIGALLRHGIDDIVVLVNHAADQIDEFFRLRRFDARIRLIDDGEPRGTAGALLACLDQLDEQFVVAYGDTLFDLDITHMLAFHRAARADVTLLLHPNDHPADSDLVELDASSRVTRFHGYPHPPGADLRNLVNAAFYVVEKAALKPWRDFSVPSDLAKHLFPSMVEAGARIQGYISYEYIKDLGTPSRLDKAEKHLRTGVVERASRRQRQKAVFLDRDGTLNELRDYVRRPEDLALLVGAADAVRRFNNAEFRVVVVTNQPVIARGECSVETLREIHNRLEARLGESGGFVDGIYYCPHHPHAGYAGEVVELKRECDCRKPGVAMLTEAMTAMNIDPAQSWMIGDSTSDILAAQRAGVRSILVQTGEGGRDSKWKVRPDFVCADLAACASVIIDVYPSVAQAMGELLAAIQPGDLLVLDGEAAQKSFLAGVLVAELRARGRSIAYDPPDAATLTNDGVQPEAILVVEAPVERLPAMQRTWRIDVRKRTANLVGDEAVGSFSLALDLDAFVQGDQE